MDHTSINVSLLQVLNVANNHLAATSLPPDWTAIAADKSSLVGSTLMIPRNCTFEHAEDGMEVAGESDGVDVIKVTILGNAELLRSIS